MSNKLIPIHVTRAAKERGIAAAAGIRGIAAGLSPIQIEALMRYARDRYRKDHVSAASAVADAWAKTLEMASGARA